MLQNIPSKAHEKMLQTIFCIFLSLSEYLGNHSVVLDLDLLWHPALKQEIYFNERFIKSFNRRFI